MSQFCSTDVIASQGMTNFLNRNNAGYYLPHITIRFSLPHKFWQDGLYVQRIKSRSNGHEQKI